MNLWGGIALGVVALLALSLYGLCCAAHDADELTDRARRRPLDPDEPWFEHDTAPVFDFQLYRDQRSSHKEAAASRATSRRMSHRGEVDEHRTV